MLCVQSLSVEVDPDQGPMLMSSNGAVDCHEEDENVSEIEPVELAD